MRVTALLVLHLFSATARLDWGNETHPNDAYGNTSLCYKLEWGDAVRYSAGIRPITGLPAQHPSVVNDLCGLSLSPGDPIRPGPFLNSAGNCRSKSGPEHFYAYGYPYGSSANTGYYKDRSAVLYIIEDESGLMYLVLTLDTPTSGVNGEFALDISSQNVPPGWMQLQLLDDPDEYRVNWHLALQYGHVKYDQWDPATATGSFFWRWWTCCTVSASFSSYLTGDSRHAPAT